MTWMLTATGRTFDLQFIQEGGVSIDDVAHHLAQINRYTGAARRPYSVAEHSLLVVEILRMYGVVDRRVLLLGLMHDAHEAYTNDISTPVKSVVGPAWSAFENRVQHVVLSHFGLLTTNAAHHDAIKWADMVALRTERKQLLPPGGPVWPCEATHANAAWVDLSERDSYTWDDWRRAFRDEFDNLTFEHTPEPLEA